MALPNNQIEITPGTGEIVATQLINDKEYQVVIQAGDDGHILGSKLVYVYNIPSQVHVASANTVHWDLFNASTKLVRVISIRQIPDVTIAVTGVAFAWKLARTTSIGTNGSLITAWLPDLSQDALNTDITCRSKPTGGAAENVILRNYNMHAEETNVGAIIVATLGGVELVPNGLVGGRGILLRQNQGLRCVQITSNANGNTGWLIGFTVE